MSEPGRRILVVEDSPTQAERLRLVLEDAGYRVDVAANGEDGLKKAAAAPDMVISDVTMPGMNGFSLCQTVKADPRLRSIPFVLLTAHRTPGDILRGLEVGADNFITKPFEDTQLLQRVARIFENRARRRPDMELTVRVAGREIVVNADKEQMIELLFSTSDELAQSNHSLEEARRQLEEQARQLERMVEKRTQELRAAELRYRTLVEHLPAVVYLADPGQAGRFDYMSPQIEPLLGYPAGQWLSDPDLLSRVLPDQDRERVLRQFAPDSDAEGVAASEFALTRKDGEVVWVSNVARLVDGPQGRGSWLQGVMVDIRERRTLEAQLGMAQRMESVGRLAGGIAHDFNNILGVITGFNNLAVGQLPENHPVQPRLIQIRRAADKAIDLTRQLLAFSRRQVLQPKVLDVGALLDDVRPMLQRLIGEDVELIMARTGEHHRIEADPTKVEQVLLNLVINARDAMPRGGTLSLEVNNELLDAEYFRRRGAAGEPGPYVRLAVSDTGIGMEPEVQARIFEPFYTTKPEGVGTGLGLSTAYGIVKQSGGFIWVYSEVGQGTVFKIYLPRVDAEDASLEEDSPEEDTAPRGTETIMVVEDQEALRALTCELLEHLGYTVLAASDGQEALKLAAQEPGPIHLLVSDVVMPHMDGRELAERLSGLRPDLRVLYISGYTDGTITHRGLLGAGVSLLEKPFTLDTLAVAVRSVLDRHD